MRPQVRLTFSQASGQADLWSDVPPTEMSCGQVCYFFGQVDLWSDVLPTETSCGQDFYYCGQVDLLSDIPPKRRLHVRLMFSQTLGQAEL